MGFSNFCVKCVLRTSIGMMMMAVSPLKNNDVAASLSSWERVFFKNRVGKAKFWLLLLITLFGVLVHITNAQGTPSELKGTTLDFETGDLSGWTKGGGVSMVSEDKVPDVSVVNAFDYQPTRGDNPTARDRGQPSNHQGDYWIGTYERYQGLSGQKPGQFQGDEPVGYIQSPYFTIPSGTLSFLIGGGSSFATRVEFFVRDPRESRKLKFYATGKDTETMERVTWNLTPFAGKTGGLRIVDESSGPWGHINVDDFIFKDTVPPTVPTTGSISVSSNPSGASIYLDGSYQGTTPFTINNVKAGSHKIKLELTGYLEWSQTIDVAAGQTSPVTAPLTQIPILEIIIVIFGISTVIVIFYIFIKPLESAPPEGDSGDGNGEEYPEDKKAAAPPLVGKVEEVPVLLAVSAPEVVKPGDIFTARLAAYIESLEEEVKEELIRLSRRRSESYMGVESCRWKLDTHVTVKLSGKHLKVDPSESEFVWKGERNLVNFLVEVLADAPEEWTVLRYEVFIKGIRVAFIPLDLEITSSIKSDKRNIATIEPAHTAFASYASQDRVRVLDRVAAVSISAGLDIFMDCLSIHPGEKWKKKLESEIEKRDIFLLFWSANAKNSEWVTWEWKMALVKKEESALQLHPLQTVTEAPPPEELKKFHFGDIYMIIRNDQEKKV